MPPTALPTTLTALRADQFGYDQAAHLLRRAGFGGTPAEVRSLANLGLDDAVDYLVDYHEIEDEGIAADLFDHNIMRPVTQEQRRIMRRAREQKDEAAIEAVRKERQKRQRADRKQIATMKTWWLQRLIDSPRPLEEKMTLFWHGHFATGYRTIEDSYHMFLQNQRFRAGALGDFRNLVLAIVHDPAMLRYLDNNRNNRQRPNENLARELMELFTMGEGNGYTEHDIKEGARALTGYTYNDDSFRFNARQHDQDPKTIFGSTGRYDGDGFVQLIFNKRGRQVSEFLTLKLYRFFVNDLPGEVSADHQKFIMKLAGRYRDRNWSTREFLRTLFRSAHFYDSSNIAAQIKSPLQLVVQGIRTLRAPTRDIEVLLAATRILGQEVFYPPSVKGWPGGRSWINTSTLFTRQNTLLYVLTGQRPDRPGRRKTGERFKAESLVAPLLADDASPTPRHIAEYLLQIMLSAPPHPDRIEALTEFLTPYQDRLDNDVLVGALSLIVSLPEYQLC